MSVEVEDETVAVVISLPEDVATELIVVLSVDENERSSMVPDCEVDDSLDDSVLSLNAPVIKFPLPVRVDSEVEVDVPVMLRSVFASARSSEELEFVVELIVKTPVISLPLWAVTISNDSSVSLDADCVWFVELPVVSVVTLCVKSSVKVPLVRLPLRVLSNSVVVVEVAVEDCV